MSGIASRVGGHIFDEAHHRETDGGTCVARRGGDSVQSREDAKLIEAQNRVFGEDDEVCDLLVVPCDVQKISAVITTEVSQRLRPKVHMAAHLTNRCAAACRTMVGRHIQYIVTSSGDGTLLAV